MITIHALFLFVSLSGFSQVQLLQIIDKLTIRQTKLQQLKSNFGFRLVGKTKKKHLRAEYRTNQPNPHKAVNQTCVALVEDRYSHGHHINPVPE